MLKLLPYFIFFILVGCKEKNETKQNSFDLECRIITLKDSITKTENEIIAFKSSKKSQNKIDSLQIQTLKLKRNFDSLLSETFEKKYDSIESNLINKLNLIKPNKEQKEFLLYLYAYKILGPHHNIVFDGWFKLPKENNFKSFTSKIINSQIKTTTFILKLKSAPQE